MRRGREKRKEKEGEGRGRRKEEGRGSMEKRREQRRKGEEDRIFLLFHPFGDGAPSSLLGSDETFRLQSPFTKI